MDLFDGPQIAKEPLAARMRPRTLEEYIGQDHIVGKGRLLRRAIAADQLTSVIFYGPPGTGKTTLARVIANHTKSNFITLNAVLTGVQAIRDSIAQAEQHYKLYGKRTILFVDEVHRWNKSQQDALLPWVENGTIILVGATTENPFFEVNKALVSRSRVFQLKPLEYSDLEKAALNTIADSERGYGRWKIRFEEGALEHLIETANGDARSLLNALELAIETTPEKWEPNQNPCIPPEGSVIYISKEAAEESIQRKVVLYDRDGDYHYDIISAFIKSLRGRDPDAAMYWLAKMVAAGEDPHFIFRRMLISACEDTGLADPMALTVVESCAAAFDRVGLPEGRYHLAHAALYLATAPKSNSSMAFFDALAAVEKEDKEVPNHLRDSSRDAEGFGHGAGYMYPHAYKDHWVAQQYLPDALIGRVFYTPSDQGYEKTIKQEVLSKRELQVAAILQEKYESSEQKVNPISEWWIAQHFDSINKKNQEQLTFSPKDEKKNDTLEKAENTWRRRLDSNKTQVLQELREKIMELAAPLRHSRNFIWNGDDGLLLWECTRKSPEGLTVAICHNPKSIEILNQYATTLSHLDRPLLALNENTEPGSFSLYSKTFGHIPFDRLYFKDIFTTKESIVTFKTSLEQAIQEEQLAPGWRIVIAQRIPKNGQRLAKMILEQINPLSQEYFLLLKKMQQAEEDFFTDTTNPLFSWDVNSVVNIFSEENSTGVKGYNISFLSQSTKEKRWLTAQEIQRWMNKETSAYRKALSKSLAENECQEISALFYSISKEKILDWQIQTTYFIIEGKNL